MIIDFSDDKKPKPKQTRTIVTVMSDASWCPDTFAAGWGIWTKSNRGTYRAGGPFKSKIESASEAEARALRNAVILSFQQGIAVAGDRLIVQIDCMTVIHRLSGRLTKHDLIQDVCADIRERLRKEKVIAEYRHVKAHTSGEISRNWVNNYCDETAKRHMRYMRKVYKDAM